MDEFIEAQRLPRRVRYATFSGNSGWIACLRAEVKGEVLEIITSRSPDGLENCIWVPLHYVRGQVEYGPLPTAEEMS